MFEFLEEVLFMKLLFLRKTKIKLSRLLKHNFKRFFMHAKFFQQKKVPTSTTTQQLNRHFFKSSIKANSFKPVVAFFFENFRRQVGGRSDDRPPERLLADDAGEPEVAQLQLKFYVCKKIMFTLT